MISKLVALFKEVNVKAGGPDSAKTGQGVASLQNGGCWGVG